jgi:pyruvate formate lyase activating enzyme
LSMKRRSAGAISRIRRERRRTRRQLPILRLQKLSLWDYPGRLCAKAIIPGCNFRCPFCVDMDLLYHHRDSELVPEGEVLDHLYRVRGFLDGLCLGGGEPTLHNGLLSFAYRVKSIGYNVKLDTNGTRPKRLKKMMEERVVDYVALEVKAPLRRYPEVVGCRVNLDDIVQSIRLLRRGSVDYEFRTTVVPGLLDGDDLEEIAQTLAGSKRFVIQRFRPGARPCPGFEDAKPYGVGELREFRDRVIPYFGDCRLRL